MSDENFLLRIAQAARHANDLAEFLLPALEQIERGSNQVLAAAGNKAEPAAVAGGIAMAAGQLMALSLHFSRMAGEELTPGFLGSAIYASAVLTCERLGITDIPETFHVAPETVQ